MGPLDSVVHEHSVSRPPAVVKKLLSLARNGVRLPCVPFSKNPDERAVSGPANECSPPPRIYRGAVGLAAAV